MPHEAVFSEGKFLLCAHVVQENGALEGPWKLCQYSVSLNFSIACSAPQ